MESSGIERIYRLADFIMKVAYINLLTIFFTLIGLIVFGFFPAIHATFYIFRKWLTGYSDIPITKHYWQTYKREFIKSNGIGMILLLVGSLLYINLSIAEVISEPVIQLSYYPILMVFILFLCTCLYVFPIYLHYRISFIQVFKNAFLLLFFQPLYTIFMIAGILILFYLLIAIPGLMLFFSVSIFAYIVMFFSLKIFEKLELVKEVS